MSLSKDALDTITANAIAASGAALDTDVPAVLVPKGYEVQKIDHLHARPARFRGTFRTPSFDGFVQYVQLHANDESTGFVNTNDGLEAAVIFDLGDAKFPGHCNHIACLMLKPTAPFTAAQNACKGPLKQRDLVEWLEDWAPHITPIAADGNPMTIPAAIDAIRRMRIETKGERVSEISEMSAKRSALEEVEAKSQGQLPAGFEFQCIPYDQLGPVVLRLRLSVLTSDESPTFRLRWVLSEARLAEIAEDFKRLLRDRLGPSVTLINGHFVNQSPTRPPGASPGR